MSALQGSNPVPLALLRKRRVLQLLSSCGSGRWFIPSTITHPHSLDTFVAELSS